MKPQPVAVLLLFVCTIAFAQTEKKTNSTIKEVTVFLQGAQVTRTAPVELKPGNTTIVLQGTSPRIIENSIQAEVNQNVKIVGVSFRINHMEDLKKPEKTRALEKERERLTNLIAHEKAAITIYDEEETLLKSNRSLAGRDGVVINELKTAVEFFRIRLFEIREHKLQVNDRISQHYADIRKIDAQLKSMSGIASQPQGEIIVKLESKTDVRAQLKVSYLVQEASWFPLYDVRAKDIQSPIDVTYKASVSQQSGEDWDNIKLTVSSGNPIATGAKPVIKPWILGQNNSYQSLLNGGLPSTKSMTNSVVQGKVVDDNGEALPGVNVLIQGTSVGTVTNANGEYSISLTADAKILLFSFIGYVTKEYEVTGQAVLDVSMQPDVNHLSEVVVVGYARQEKKALTSAVTIRGNSVSDYAYVPKVKQVIAASPVVRQTNVEFSPETSYTIKSENMRQIVDMIVYEVDALYEYYAAPKLDHDAFLTARLVNWDEYNFMEGEASLFFEGKYIGKTILDTRNTSDTLTLSLGRDKNVIVTRDKKKELSSNQFVGSNRKSLFAYEINVRNKKAYPINVRVEDQLPVPNTREISVDDIQHSNASKNNDTGVLTWNLKIEPGKTQKLDLRYEVKYPKNTNIILE